MGIIKQSTFGTNKLILFAALTIFAGITSTGIPWGWSSLVLILENEGVYQSLCEPSSEEPNHEELCPAQIARLNLIFTIGSITANVVALPVGFLLDKLGDRLLGLIGSSILMLGSMLFGLSLHFKFDGYIISYFLLGLGCPCIFLSFMKLSRIFGKHMPLILSLFNGAFDASTLVFMIFKVIYDHNVKIYTIWYVYILFPLSIGLSTFFWPKESDMPSEDPHHQSETSKQEIPLELESDDINSDSNNDEIIEDKEELDYEKEFSPSHKPHFFSIDPLLLRDLKSNAFIFGSAFIALNQLFINFYIGTIEVQLKEKLGDTEGQRLTNIFNAILPFGFFFSPFIGLVLGKLKAGTSFLILSGMMIIYSLFNVFSSPALHIINFVIFTLVRAYFYSAIDVFVVEEFGFARIGQLYGTTQTVAGIFGLLQSVFVWVTVYHLNGNFIPVNILQVIVCTSFISFGVWLKRRDQQRGKEYVHLDESINKESSI